MCIYQHNHLDKMWFSLVSVPWGHNTSQERKKKVFVLVCKCYIRWKPEVGNVKWCSCLINGRLCCLTALWLEVWGTVFDFGLCFLSLFFSPLTFILDVFWLRCTNLHYILFDMIDHVNKANFINVIDMQTCMN